MWRINKFEKWYGITWEKNRNYEKSERFFWKCVLVPEKWNKIKYGNFENKTLNFKQIEILISIIQIMEKVLYLKVTILGNIRLFELFDI